MMNTLLNFYAGIGLLVLGIIAVYFIQWTYVKIYKWLRSPTVEQIKLDQRLSGIDFEISHANALLRENQNKLDELLKLFKEDLG